MSKWENPYAVNWFSFSAWKNHTFGIARRSLPFLVAKSDCIIMKVKCIAQMAAMAVTRYRYIYIYIYTG